MKANPGSQSAQSNAFRAISAKAQELIASKIMPKVTGIATQYFRRPSLFNASLKQDNSIVTIADTEIEQAISSIIINHFDEPCAILGEEAPPHKLNAQSQNLLWVIDPIDGTAAFAAGKPTFTTLISLVMQGPQLSGEGFSEGLPIVSFIIQPILGEVFHCDETGAYLNGNKLTPKPAPSQGHESGQGQGQEGYVIATTSPRLLQGRAEGAFNALAQNAKSITYGGDAYNYCMLAMGLIDIIIESGVKIYDITAPCHLINCAGGSTYCKRLEATTTTSSQLSLSSVGQGTQYLFIAASSATAMQKALTLFQ